MLGGAFAGAASCSLFVDTSGLDTGPSARSDAGDAGRDSSVPFDGPRDGPRAPDVRDVGIDSRAGDAEAGACPSGRGPEMVALDLGAPFCMDSTEVTVGQYNVFLAAVSSGYTPVTPARCGWNDTYTMPMTSDCQLEDNYPVGCVNWCQAYAFCAWAGKHLCGGVDGGSVAVDVELSLASEWGSACTNAGTTVYSYGNTYESYCNTPNPQREGGSEASVPVATLPKCVGPPGIFDLEGNASEWQDSCQEVEAGAGANDICDHLGGASSSYRACLDLDSDIRSGGYYHGYPLGFRCCSP
jgi:formylglycine-generating enzyme